jgi:hypothetical protein
LAAGRRCLLVATEVGEVALLIDAKHERAAKWFSSYGAIHVGLVYGYLALGLGWIPPSTIPWSANLLLIIGWVLFRRKGYFAALCLAIPDGRCSFSRNTGPPPGNGSAPGSGVLALRAEA